MKTEKNQPENTPEAGKNEFQYMSLSETGETASRRAETAETEPVLSWELLTDDGRKAEGPDAASSRAEEPVPEKDTDEPTAGSTSEPIAEPIAESITEPIEEPSAEPTAEDIAALLRAEESASAPPERDDGQAEEPTAAPSAENAEGSPEEPADGSVPEPLSPEERRFRRVRGLFDYVETFCLALAAMILLFLFVFRYVAVDGGSMEPTLHGGEEDHTYFELLGESAHADRLIISDFFYTPKTGDIVVISKEDRGVETMDSIIKRVIATEGQTVRINFRTWEVSVDGVTLDEDYINRMGGDMSDGSMNQFYGVDENGVCEFTVSPGKVFVMGDNRNNSSDSRMIGEQDVDHILGRVLLRIYPFDEFGTV